MVWISRINQSQLSNLTLEHDVISREKSRVSEKLAPDLVGMRSTIILPARLYSMFASRIFLPSLNVRTASFLAMAGRSAERNLAHGWRSREKTRESSRGVARSYASSRERRRDGSDYRRPRNQRYDSSRWYSDDGKYRSDSRVSSERRSRQSEGDNSGSRRQKRKLEIEKMLEIEHHHIRSKDESLKEVIWCPRYISRDIRGHIRGGTALLHHRCRRCRRLCLHLTGTPGTTVRLCLECSGWEEKHIPSWYYHRSCKYCSGQREDF